MLEWLGRIADAAAYGETTDEDDGNDPGVTEAVRDVRGLIYDGVLPHLLAPDPTVREAALSATAALLQSPELTGRVSGTTQILRQLLAESTDRRERAATILAIGAWARTPPDGSPTPTPPSGLAPLCHRDAPATPRRRGRSSAPCSTPRPSTPGSANPPLPTLGLQTRCRTLKVACGMPFRL
ncbi:hypothetical protein OG361_04100 [Streptomyces sp. NBC_00090]|uniref:hypothetical protein n=1 Tax=Streptomyces sp. NBC_00090 TaxID=2903619 RepID=UPI00324C8CAA